MSRCDARLLFSSAFFTFSFMIFLTIMIQLSDSDIESLLKLGAFNLHHASHVRRAREDLASTSDKWYRLH